MVGGVGDGVIIIVWFLTGRLFGVGGVVLGLLVGWGGMLVWPIEFVLLVVVIVVVVEQLIVIIMFGGGHRGSMQTGCV